MVPGIPIVPFYLLALARRAIKGPGYQERTTIATMETRPTIAAGHVRTGGATSTGASVSMTATIRK